MTIRFWGFMNKELLLLGLLGQQKYFLESEQKWENHLMYKTKNTIKKPIINLRRKNVIS